jgi:hypothetical protein
MKLFVSYAHEQRAAGEEIHASLSAQGFDVFFDRSDLRTGEEYDRTIKQSIEGSDLFLCLVSPEFVRPGSYSLTEVGIRRRVCPNPSGKTLPVMVKATLLKKVDPYLRAVTILYPQGNLAADVSAAVQDLVAAPSAHLATSTREQAGGTHEALHGERIVAYKALWSLTQVLPKWPRDSHAQYEDLRTFSVQLRDWYFGNGGGLFLSRRSHTAYSAVQNSLTAVLFENPAGVLSEDDYDAIREACSALRSQLARDIGARE